MDRAWFWFGIGFALLGTVLALVPSAPTLVPDFSWVEWIRDRYPQLKVFVASDKLEHVLGFGLLMGWFSQLYVSKHDRLWLAAMLLAHAALIEWLQSFTTWRSAELGDWVAGAIGIALGWACSYPRTWCFLDLLRRRIEPERGRPN